MKTSRQLVTTIAVLLILLSTFLSSSVRHLTQPDDAEQAIRNLEQRWLKNEDNPNALATILADDFVQVMAVGFIGKQDQISYLRKHPQTFLGTKHFDELRVSVYGSTAIANGIVAETPEGSSSAQKTVFTDVFVKRHEVWRAVNAQELPWHPMDSHIDAAGVIQDSKTVREGSGGGISE